MTSHEVDRELLYRWVDDRRRKRGIRWFRVAEETGISTSSLSEFVRGGGLSADAIVSLMVWSDGPVGIFVRKNASRP